MLKKYKSNSHVAFSVPLPTGKSARVSFTPLTGGGSVYYTESSVMQAALESHPKFGRLFTLAEVHQEPQVVKKAKVQEPAEPKVKTINVPSLEDAKAYLVENYGISRTKLRSRKQIEDAAAANGIVFNFE